MTRSPCSQEQAERERSTCRATSATTDAWCSSTPQTRISHPQPIRRHDHRPRSRHSRRQEAARLRRIPRAPRPPLSPPVATYLLNTTTGPASTSQPMPMQSRCIHSNRPASGGVLLSRARAYLDDEPRVVLSAESPHLPTIAFASPPCPEARVQRRRLDHAGCCASGERSATIAIVRPPRTASPLDACCGRADAVAASGRTRKCGAGAADVRVRRKALVRRSAARVMKASAR